MQHSTSPGMRTALRAIHCISAYGWIGGGIAVLIVLKLAGAPAGHEEAAAFQRSITAIDDFLIIPAAGMATVSGALLSLAKHGSERRWITEKCIITALLLIFGTFWLAPALQSLVSVDFGQPDFEVAYHRHWFWGSAAALFQLAGLLLLVALSTVMHKTAKPPARLATLSLPKHHAAPRR